MLKASEYEPIVNRPYTPLFAGFLYTAVARIQTFKPFLKKPFSYKNALLIDGDWYYSHKEHARLIQLTYKAWKKPKIFRWSISKFQQLEKNLLAAARKRNYENYRKAYEQYMPALALMYILDEIIDRDLRNAFSKVYLLSEVDDLMHRLNTPLEDNYQRLEKYDLARTHSIGRHARRYAWLLSRYGERKTYTKEMAEIKRKKMNRRQSIAEYRKIKKDTQEAIRTAKAILPVTKRHLIDVMQFIIFYRTQRTDVMNRSAYEFYPGLIAKAKELGCSYHDLLYMTPEEVAKKHIPKSELAARKTGFALLIDDGKIRIADHQEYRRLRKTFLVNTSAIESVRGTAASPGCAKGIVKIVHNSADILKVRAGNIIVATMTTPNYITAMHRAGGYVTDEGGITCHAAILSRELDKPCVIGTKIATKVFKDGDRVEVDADNGIVRKIS